MTEALHFARDAAYGLVVAAGLLLVAEFVVKMALTIGARIRRRT